MKILFHEDKEYCGTRYHKGEVYEIPEERGMALRWLKRGCTQVVENKIIVEKVDEVVDNDTEVEKEIVVKSNRKARRKYESTAINQESSI